MQIVGVDELEERIDDILHQMHETGETVET